jgi:hypothetical protein
MNATKSDTNARVTAPTNGDNVDQPSTIEDIDRRIAILQEERRAARRKYQTFETFARLPWRHSGAGVIRSASDACVVLIADADFAADGAEKNVARDTLARMVVGAVNSHDDLLVALKEVAPHVCSLLCPSTWRTGHHPPHHERCQAVTAAIAKAEGR